MSARLLAAAFLLSILVPLAEAAFPEVPLARGSLAALALLPWLALAPLPRRPRGESSPAWRAALLSAAMALPPLGLGAGVDLARGAEPRVLAAAAAAAWGVLFLWSWAAEVAARVERAHGAFALAWFLCLPGASALRVALGWVPLGSGAGEPGRGTWLALDPLVWCHRWGRAGGLAELGLAELAFALGAAWLVVVLVHVLGRGARAEAA